MKYKGRGYAKAVTEQETGEARSRTSSHAGHCQALGPTGTFRRTLATGGKLGQEWQGRNAKKGEDHACRAESSQYRSYGGAERLHRQTAGHRIRAAGGAGRPCTGEGFRVERTERWNSQKLSHLGEPQTVRKSSRAGDGPGSAFCHRPCRQSRRPPTKSAARESQSARS